MATAINIILARDVPNLGKVGELCKVKPGYARNFLFPKQFALPLSPGRLKEFEHQKKLIAHKLLKLRTESERLKSKLDQMTLNITAKAGKQGKIFGSVGTRNIEEALKLEGFVIDHRDIKLESPLKTLGLHIVGVRLEADVKAEIKVIVVAEKVEEVKAEADTYEASEEKAQTSQEDADSSEETPILAESETPEQTEES